MQWILILLLLSFCGLSGCSDRKWYKDTMDNLEKTNRSLDSMIDRMNRQQPFRDSAFMYSRIRHECMMKSLDELNQWILTDDPAHKATMERWDDSVGKYGKLMRHYYGKVDAIK